VTQNEVYNNESERVLKISMYMVCRDYSALRLFSHFSLTVFNLSRTNLYFIFAHILILIKNINKEPRQSIRSSKLSIFAFFVRSFYIFRSTFKCGSATDKITCASILTFAFSFSFSLHCRFVDP
jgi:hypothetical protein